MNLPFARMARHFPVVLLFAGLAASTRAQTILPDATSGEAYTFQLATTPPQAAGTTYAADGLPAGLSIDGSSGVISGVTTAVGLYKGTLTLTNGSVTPFPYQITVDPAAGAPAITSNGSVFGTVGSPLAYTITASNGPTGFNVAQLPPGLVSSGPQISGTPTTAGFFFTSVSADNGSGQGATLVLFFTIAAAGPLPSLTSPALASSPAGAPLTYTITATNSPTSFAAFGLPSGLSLDTGTGIISGTPAAPQVAIVSLTASNSYGSSLPRNLVLTIGDYSAITSPATAAATAGSGFSYSLAASNSPVTYNLAGLPGGLAFNSSSGAIAGTPATAGTYTLQASANNALGTGPSTALTFTVADPVSGSAPLIAPMILSGPSSQSATVGSTVQLSVDAVGSGSLGYQWMRDGIPIAGANASTLSLAMVDADNSGSYTVFVANPQGSVLSAPAVVSVQSFFVPPIVTEQPSKASATAGSPVSFTVGAAGIEPLSYQWLANGAPIAGATSATLTIPAVQASDAGTYSVIVTNPAGSATSEGAALQVFTGAFAPIFQFQPSAVTVTSGGTASLSVGVVGSPPITYQWSVGGVQIPGATSPSLTFSPAGASDAGVYSVAVSDSAGSITSVDAQLTVDAAGGPPVPVSLVLQPTPVSTAVGGSATFSVAATGDAPVSYQWRKNQAPIAGATQSTFTISDVQASDAGTYDVEVSNPFSADVSFPTPLVVLPGGSPSRLVNVSVRGFSGVGAQALDIGFVVGGTAPESALVRAVGPTLAEFGLSGLLADPELSVYGQASALVASNDNWGGTQALTDAFSQAGAFTLPADSLDSALVASLSPGAYSAQVSGTGRTTGVVLLEMYDIGNSTDSRFVNVSARGMAGSGSNVLTVGFAIEGASSKTVLIRGIGPTLSAFSVGGSLQDPQLSVFDANQNMVGSDTGWGGSIALQAVFDSVGAFPLPLTSDDSAVMLTLPPGAYSAEVSGASGSTGIALIEVYELP